MSEITTDESSVRRFAAGQAVIDLRDDAESSTLVVTGEIDIANAPRLHERLMGALGIPENDVLVDLRRVTFIDSTGLGVLVNARQRAHATGATLRLMLPEGRARFPFEVTGLAELFDGDHSRFKRNNV